MEIEFSTAGAIMSSSMKKASRTKSLSLGDDLPLKTLPASSSAAATASSSSSQTMTKGLSSNRSGSSPNGNPLAMARQKQRSEDTGKIMKLIDDNIIGKGCAFLGPYGRRKLVYADYLSSGRSLQFLEDYINKEVLPASGDLSCTSAVTGLQSQLYNNEVRDLVKSAVNASPDDEIIFCDGNYASPIERLCYMLCSTGISGGGSSSSTSQSQLNSTSLSGSMSSSAETDPTMPQGTPFDHQDSVDEELPGLTLKMSASTPTMQHQKSICMTPPLLYAQDSGPILFVSTCEIAANLQPWIDAGAQIERIPKNREGFLDLDELSKKLEKHQNSKRRLIGLFSAASRLTGILADDVATTILLHQYGALSLWDYSHSAPFSPINTNPLLPGASKDVVFFTMSKFIGGVQAPGVIVVKKCLLKNLNITSFNDNVGVIGAVRAGLVIQLKESLGVQNIMNKQEKICKQMLSHIRTIPEIVLLGPNCTTAKRIPTICFLVKHPRGAFLHNRFVVAILNDIFGIQATAGSHIGYALGISEKLIVDYERVLMDESLEAESLRPGYTRLSLPYFMSDAEIGFILEALKMVATEAWKLLPQYECDNKSGEWRHHSNSLAKERKWLGAIRYTDGKMLFSDRKISGPGAFPQNYQDCLQTARNLFNRARKMAQKSSLNDSMLVKLKQDRAEDLRWYMLPGEAHELLVGHSQNVKNVVPFHPNKASKDLLSLLIMHRHNSLSALDVRKFKSRSLPLSPVQVPRQQSTPSPISPVPRPDHCISPPTVRFSLGGEVTTLTGGSKVPSHISGDHGSYNPLSRHRCNSWSSSALSSIKLKHMTNGGVGNGGPTTATTATSMAGSTIVEYQTPYQSAMVRRRRRICSCGSQTDLAQSPHMQSPSPTPSLQNWFGSSINDCPEDIQAYVKEVTQDIATEIKSELREVINQVEDVLENTDGIDVGSYNLSSFHQLTSADEMKNDIMADVAEYLKEFSKEMASEVKSEIREVCNSVTDFNSNLHSSTSPDLVSPFSIRKNSPPELEKQLGHGVKRSTPPPQTLNLNQRHSDAIAVNFNRRDVKLEQAKTNRSESFPSRPNSTPAWPHSGVASPDIGLVANRPYTGAISKLIDTSETASRDSGINMCFVDSADSSANQCPFSFAERSGIPIRGATTVGSDIRVSELLEEVESMKVSPVNPSRCPMARRQQSDPESDNETKHWHNMPKEVWKQTSEALDEFDMIRDGDRILVALSGSSASLLLLHAIRQFARARCLHIEMTAASIGASGIDPRALMLYLKDLGVDYIFEQPSTESVKHKLATIAKRNSFNVMAMGDTLDKLAGDFFVSILNKGRLHTTKAHSHKSGNDLRIIRPFIYVRERLLEDISIKNELPTRPSRTFSAPSASNSILKVQEIVNPSVYDNIKTALKPLLSNKFEALTSYEVLRSAFYTRE